MYILTLTFNKVKINKDILLDISIYMYTHTHRASIKLHLHSNCFWLWDLSGLPLPKLHLVDC